MAHQATFEAHAFQCHVGCCREFEDLFLLGARDLFGCCRVHRNATCSFPNRIGRLQPKGRQPVIYTIPP